MWFGNREPVRLTPGGHSSTPSRKTGPFRPGLITITLPVASAWVVLRTMVAMGPFHGLISAVIPKGSQRTILEKNSRTLYGTLGHERFAWSSPSGITF